MRLYNFETEKEEEIPSDLAQRLIENGSHATYKNDEIPILNPSGDMELIYGSEVSKALESGWKLPDERATAVVKDEKIYGAMNGEAAAAAYARGISMGFSDPALVGFGVDPEHIRKLKEYNPYLSPIMEGVGIASSLMAGPAVTALGTKVIGKLAGTAVAETTMGAAGTLSKFIPTKLANAANTGIENLARKAMVRVGGITAESSAIAKLATQYIPKGVGSAVEGAMYGVGQLASEHSLGEAELSGENMFANMYNLEKVADYASNGAIWGGSLGMLIPGFADAAIRTMHAAPDAVNTMAKAFGRYARIDDNKVEDFLKAPFEVPMDKAGNIINRDDFAEKLVNAATKFREDVALRSIDVDQALALHKEYKDIYSEQSIKAKEQFTELKKDLDIQVSQLKQELKDANIDPDLVNEIKNTFINGEKYRNQLSEESYKILDNTPDLVPIVINGSEQLGETFIPTRDVINHIKQYAANKFEKTTKGEPFIKGEEQQSLVNLISNTRKIYESYEAKVSKEIKPPRIKEFIQSIDSDIEKRGGFWMQTPDINFLKDVRSFIDNRVKASVPEYQAKMIAVSQLSETLSAIKSQYGKSIKKLGSEAESVYFSDDSIKSRILRIAKNEKNADGILRAINDVRAYLPEKMKSAYNIEATLQKMRNDYNLANDTGNYASRMEELNKIDPTLKSAENFKENARKNSLIYNRGKKYLDRSTSEVIRQDILDRLPSLKRVTDQKQKYQDLLGKLHEAEKEYAIWKDVDTQEKALYKLSTYESIGKKEHLVKVVSDKHKSLKKLMGNLGDLPENDLTDIINTLRIEAAFQKTSVNGSRNVNAWSRVIGGVVGGVAGGAYAGTVGAALGTAIGLYMDNYAPKVAKSILIRLSKIKGTITPTKLNKVLVDEIPKNDGEFNRAAFSTVKHIENNNKTTMDKIRSSVNKYFNNKLQGTRVLIGRYGMEYYNDNRNKLKEIVEERGMTNNNFFANNELISSIAPSTTTSFIATYNRAIDFLQTKFPTIEETSIDNFKPSNIEKLKFNRYMQYVEDPRFFFDQMANGVMSAEGIDVLKNVYPSMYKIVEATVNTELMNMDVKNLPMQKKNDITRVFGINLSRTYYPETFKILQNQSNSQQKEDAQPNQINLKSKAGERATTSMERISNRV